VDVGPLTVSASSAPGVVDVTRGPRVESVHLFSACAMDARGEVRHRVGDIDAPVFLRSAAKPFIAAAVVRAGAVERFGLEPREIAVMAASHNGEPAHIEAVASLLSKIGFAESALLCGIHPPYDAKAAGDLAREGKPLSPIYNNCSGKHAGILGLCKILGADPSTYLSPENPAERAILELCARLSDQRVEDFSLAIDGCGIPVYATTLRHAAISFSRIATLDCRDERDAAALEVVRAAMIAHPWYVAGSGEFDTALILAKTGIVAKSGAEGVHGIAIVDSGVGMVLKVLDGASRAVAPAVLGLARAWGIIPAASIDGLQGFERPELKNRAGRCIGHIEAEACP
jgi:L-asparaginase II